MKLLNIFKEIKVNAPRPFTYDAYYYDEDDESTEGELYFNGELLDGDAVYSYGFSGEEKIYYIAFYINTPTYARLFNSLSPHIHDKIIGGSTKRTLAQITDYADDYEHGLIIRDLNKVNLKNLPPFINEIKVLSPNPLKFKVRQNYYNSILGGDLYLNDKLIANGALLNTKNKTLEVVLWVKDYEKIKDQLPTHTPTTSYKETQYIIITNISGVNVVDKEGKLYEIKVVSPGLINTLKNYKSQIESSDDSKRNVELALQCAKLVLPIFEKLVPDDKIPRKVIESIQAYLLNPTIADRMSFKNIDLKSPGYPDAAKLVHNVINMVLGAIIVRDDKLPFTLSSATYAIMAAEKDQASQLKEIKVIPPPTLRFEINNERKSTVRNEFFGNLYLHSELLDDMAFLSLSKAMVTSMPKEVFDRVKDQLPPYEVLDMFGLDGMVEILFDDTKDIQIIDKQGLMNEIKVLPPPTLRLEIMGKRGGMRYEFFGKLYLHDELLDDNAFLASSKVLLAGMPKEVYDRVKNQLPPYKVLDRYKHEGNKIIEILFDDIKDIRIIDKQGLMEIKVLSPSPFRVEVYLHDEEYEEDYNAESYFNDMLLDDDTIVNTADDVIIVDILSETYDTIKNLLPPHQVLANLLGKFGLNATLTRIKIKGLKNINIIYKDSIQEIKVMPPSPFRFEVTKKSPKLTRGKLYFNGIILDDDSILYTSDNSIVADISSKILNMRCLVIQITYGSLI